MCIPSDCSNNSNKVESESNSINCSSFLLFPITAFHKQSNTTKMNNF